jgi:xylulokinase
MHKYLLGLDIGSSSVKASLVDCDSGECVSSTQAPEEEMRMLAVQPGWAEQDPEMWWNNVTSCLYNFAKKSGIDLKKIAAIGISYQMHGLVVVGKDHKPLRPSIIWCDSRAVEIGDKAFKQLGVQYCLEHFLNSPGNFTASKLKWIQENEPDLFTKIDKIMLPGDYIALRLTGEINTTATGLSEGMFWDFKSDNISAKLLEYYSFKKELLPPMVQVFAKQGRIRPEVAKQLGLSDDVVVSYRAGDQPNNAFSLNVLNPGETAATAGTSGVIYSVTDKLAFDQKSRVNTFIHINDKFEKAAIRNGVLLCINGTGILNSWLRKTCSNGTAYDYDHINNIAAQSPIGANGLVVLPFGNGAERILENKNIDASFHDLNFNQHSQAHMFRAAQEGIVFALKYGFDILQDINLKTNVIRAGKANMFLSPLFREAFVNTIGARLELYDTDGAKGAALGAGVGAGIFKSFEEAFKGLKQIQSEEPDRYKTEQYQSAYHHWKTKLNHQL